MYYHISYQGRLRLQTSPEDYAVSRARLTITHVPLGNTLARGGSTKLGIIQQGRLAEQNTSVNKQDLMAMVRFGADEIFASKSKQLTDEDIDVLLKRDPPVAQSPHGRLGVHCSVA